MNNMNITASTESLWTYIQSLSLNRENREWLAKKLLDSDNDTETLSKEELLDDFRQSCKEVRSFLDGKMELLTINDVLNEIKD